jgi:hypothetical protein
LGAGAPDRQQCRGDQRAQGATPAIRTARGQKGKADHLRLLGDGLREPGTGNPGDFACLPRVAA